MHNLLRKWTHKVYSYRLKIHCKQLYVYISLHYMLQNAWTEYVATKATLMRIVIMNLY